jgi:CelD/BcsL family acetyltransferase involved in cellulose biosynthesis
MANFQIQPVSLSDSARMKKWDAFVENHPEGSPYHLSGWLTAIWETYGFEPMLSVLTNGDGVIAGVFPFFKIPRFINGFRLISLPFSDYGGPLLGNYSGTEGAVSLFFKSLLNSFHYIESRGMVPCGDGFAKNSSFTRHQLNLQRSIADIQKGIDKRTIQYSIKKAEKAGVVVKEFHDSAGMDEFVRLNVLTRKKHGVPSQPKKWFDTLLKNIITREKGFILLAELNSQVIGASVFLLCGNSLHYKYNASDPAIVRAVSPNHFLTWTAITWGVRHSLSLLDFGRTAANNAGLMRYKEMWGTTMTDLPYFYFPKIRGTSSVNEKSPFYRMYTNAWAILPDTIAEKASSIIFKYLA